MGVLICKRVWGIWICHSQPRGTPSHACDRKWAHFSFDSGPHVALDADKSSTSLKQLLTYTVYYSATAVEKICLGQLHLLSQGDVKQSESCLSEALLTADLCVFSHLSCRAEYVCVSVVKGACLPAWWCIWMCMCKWETLRDLSLPLSCVDEQSVLLIFSQAYPALASASPVVTRKLWQFNSVDIVLAEGIAAAENICLFSAICRNKCRNIADRLQFTEDSCENPRKHKNTKQNKSQENV